MKKSNSKQKALGAFRNLGAVALITATIFFVACKQTGNTGGGGGGGKQGAPFVEGGASLILSPDNLTIKVKAKTADGSAITVEGCNETTLASGTRTTLLAKGTKVILKGKITELDCEGNKLTALNVQGCTALQELFCYENQLTELNVQGCTALKYLRCYGNKLNAQAMTALLNALPDRKSGNNAEATLYTEETGVTEENCTDFTQSEDLQKAFDGAKSRNWKLKKYSASGDKVDI